MTATIAIIDISNPKRATNTRDAFQRLGSNVHVLGWDDGSVTGEIPQNQTTFDLALIHITDRDRADKIKATLTDPRGPDHKITQEVWYSGTQGRMAEYSNKVFRAVGAEGLIDGEAQQLLDFLKTAPEAPPPPLFLRPPENSAMVGFLILAKLCLVAEFPWDAIGAMVAEDKEELLQKMEWRADAMPARTFSSFAHLNQMKDKVQSAEFWEPLKEKPDEAKGEFEYYKPSGYDKSAFKALLEAIEAGKISDTKNPATWNSFLDQVWKAFLEVSGLLGK